MSIAATIAADVWLIVLPFMSLPAIARQICPLNRQLSALGSRVIYQTMNRHFPLIQKAKALGIATSNTNEAYLSLSRQAHETDINGEKQREALNRISNNQQIEPEPLSTDDVRWLNQQLVYWSLQNQPPHAWLISSTAAIRKYHISRSAFEEWLTADERVPFQIVVNVLFYTFGSAALFERLSQRWAMEDSRRSTCCCQ